MPVLDLIGDILITVLSVWTEIYDLAVLDTAFCNSFNRPIFLSIVSGDNFVHDTILTFEDGNIYLKWLVLRMLKVKNISLSELSKRIFPREVKLYLSKLKAVRRLDIYYCESLFSVFKELQIKADFVAFADRCEEIDESTFIDEVLPLFKDSSTRHLKLSMYNGVSTNILKAISVLLPNLETLITEDFGGGITATSMCELKCSKLKKFEVQFPVDDTLISLANNCPLITDISSYYCEGSGLSDRSLLVVADKCRNLERLEIACDPTEDFIITDLSVIKLFTNCTHLNHIIIERSVITDKSLDVLLTHKRILKQIDFTGSNVTDVGVCALIKNCGLQLTIIVLSNCAHITDITLSCIAECCPLLTELEVEKNKNVTDISLLQILDKCKLLNRFNFDDKVISSAVDIVAASGADCLKCDVTNAWGHGSYFFESSRHFIKTVSIMRGISSADPHSLVVITQNCPVLLSLTLDGFLGLTDDIMCRILDNCPLLHTINIRHCPNVSNVSVLKMIGIGYQFNTIRFHHMPSLVDDILVKLIEKCCAKLKFLHLDHCVNFTNVSLLKVSKCCPMLHTLSIQNNKNITQSSLVEIVKQCPLLRALRIAKCILVDYSLLYTIKIHCEFLTTLVISCNKAIEKESFANFLMECRTLQFLLLDGVTYQYYENDVFVFSEWE